MKTDKNGYVEWNQTYGGTHFDIAWSVLQTSDGGYMIAGYTESFGAGSYDFWLVKTDKDGNMLWNQTYGGTDRDCARSLVQTDDGGYALAGQTWSYGVGNGDFWLVKTDSTGNVLWNQTYGGTDMEYMSSLFATADAGYIMAGHTSSFGAGGCDAWIVKTDSEGNLQWNQTFGGTGDDYAKSVIQVGGEDYVIVGTTESFSIGGWDVWLIKKNVESGLVWTDSTADSLALYRGATDPYWNYVRIRIWETKDHPGRRQDWDKDSEIDG